ncbi:MAG: CBS domain-containing protein [Gammaproteobacteria bacterium]|nr:CBS domain-containing protein [Gammaproteobacteria bacterium]
MNANYQCLAHDLLAPETSIQQNRHTENRTISLSDKAELVYTDFAYNRPFSIKSTASLEQINDKMVACGVRLLFVTEIHGLLQGLVTFTDLFGEKPVRYIQEHGGTREDILAQDIMTPLVQLEALQIKDVLRASVGDIVETLAIAGRQHMLVSDTNDKGEQTVSGLFSSTHLEQSLGIKIELSPRAHTFAELERALT